MTLKSFLKLVEIQTKVASQVPLLVGTLIAIYYFGRFEPLNLLLMWSSLLCVDMATTAINNYMDYQKAFHTEGYGYNGHNAIVRDKLNIQSVRGAIAGLLIVATALGLLLFLRTDWLVLAIGAVSFAIGIGYTYGPMPISRTPFGEITSGLTMGFGILFLAVYIHVLDPTWLMFGLTPENHLVMDLNLFEFSRLLLVAMPLVIGIGDIMFANNICDMEEDWKNHRYTLPISLGKPWSLKCFSISYGFAYGFILLGIIIGWMPLWTALTLVTIPIVYKQTRQLILEPVKEKNFANAVKNFIIINGVYALTWGLAILFG